MSVFSQNYANTARGIGKAGYVPGKLVHRQALSHPFGRTKLPAPSAGCRPGGAPLPAARLRLLPEAMSQGMSQPLESTQRFWDDDDDDDHEIEEATSARLIRVEDGRDGEATPVPPQGAVLSIGRSSSEEHSCNLVLHDAEKRPPVVSSRHALLQDSGGSLQLHILSTSSFT